MKIEKRQQAARAFMRFQRITKQNGSIYKSIREKGCLKKLIEMEAPSDGLLLGEFTLHF